MLHGKSGECFMVKVQSRSAAVLMPLIQQYIQPGTTVMSDEWRAYSQIPTVGMQHQTVNHSLNFVDPTSGAHTQTIESTWCQAKRMMRKTGVMATTANLFPTYLQEYLWQKKFKDTDQFFKILEHVKEHLRICCCNNY